MTDLGAWQVVLLAAVVALPFVLLLGFHPRRERLDARGGPIARAWPRSRQPRLEAEPADQH